MDRQGERVAHADVPHPARTDRGVDHRQPKRAARVMERAAPDPGRPGGPQDVRGRLDRDAARSQPAAERPRALRRRGLLVWFFSTPFVAHYLLALIAILAVPLVRLSAAPLALAWNRHR